ncbi:hypothetical protein [Maricaulis sp.]|uniref:hypothetical protein n=1 Tax=Maricaulis sp. TaxID=1486257 RepID=UPI001B046ED6|nr:hypothetical protein [Maricaulis sp.]MBO6795850.1 hypothetical protein [Maricaulis sp.]
MRRRRMLERSQRAREARDRMGGGDFNPAGMIRIAGFGAAIVVAVAVYIGFHRGGETIYDGRWGVMERLIRPIIFGANALELLALVFAGLIAWRVWKKMQS